MQNSKDLFVKAQQLIPGGVNSPVRACKSVGCDPLFINKGQGSKIYSQDGREFIDYVLSWGPLLLGHAYPEVKKAALRAVENGSSFGAPCSAEIELAEAISSALPGVDMVRMVNSGTEATMSALRLARAYTKRNKVLKFTGCYHGHVDALLASAGSGVATLCIPGTPGVPEETVKDTLLAPYNDLGAARRIFEEYSDQIAAVILEPVAGNMGLVPPKEGFLQGLRDLTEQFGALLIFDEVISGFRVSFSGAQGYYQVTPDLTCLGKIIGGGFPVGAYGGKRRIMEMIAPCGDVYQAGTLAGNPVAMAAGAATLNVLSKCDYKALAERTEKFVAELSKILEQKGIQVQCNLLSSIFTLFFSAEPVVDFASAQKSDGQLFAKYYAQMREQGVYLAPSNFECAFTSFVHSDEDFEKTLNAAQKVTF